MILLPLFILFLFSPAASTSTTDNTSDSTTDSTTDSTYVKVAKNGVHFSMGSKTFVPSGLNIAWPSHTKTPEEASSYYSDYFADLESSGGNWARVWLGPNLVDSFNPLALLRKNYTDVDSTAAGIVNSIITSAEEHNVKVLLTFDSFNGYCPDKASGNCHFTRSVFNEANGGPLNEWTGFLEFWSNPASKKAFKSLLTYAADRWGGSEAVFGWELFNEVDIAGLDLPIGFYDWHKEMAKHLRKADRGRHLISESFGTLPGNKWIDGMDKFDFTSTHNYARTSRGPQSPDVAKSNAYWSKTKVEWYHKPSLIGEFGCDDTKKGADSNFRHNLHAGLWSPFFAGGAGTGMCWFWDGASMDDDFSREWFLTEFRAFKKFTSYVDGAIGEGRELGDLKIRNVGVKVLDNEKGDVESIGSVAGDSELSFAWFHDSNDTCESETPTKEFKGKKVWFSLLADGKYNVAWIDTKTGEVVKEEKEKGSKGGLTVTVPDFIQDIVAVVYKI